MNLHIPMMKPLELSASLPVSVQDAGKPIILYIVTRAERGGAQTHLLSLACAMRRDFEVAVAVGEEGFLTEACRQEGIQVYVLRHLQREIRPVADIRALQEIRELLRSLRPDLIHAHTSKAGILGRLAGRLFGVPSIYTVHTGLTGAVVASRLARTIAGPCERAAANWCQRMIVVCDAGTRALQSYNVQPESKIVVIHNGIPDSSERADLASNHPPVIACVARFVELKNHEVLLRAFASGIPESRLRLVGDGPTRERCEKLAHQLGIGDRVDFLGDRDDVPTLLATSDLFVLPSKFEMFSISILEAMRAGLPVISSDVGGVSEAVVHGETGLLAPSNSVIAFAQAMTRLLNDPALRRRFGRSARRRFQERFLIAHQQERTRSVYLDVLFECGRIGGDFQRAPAA